MNTALFRRFAGGSPAFLAVWGGQTERETPLCNIKLHAARVRVCVGLAALAGVGCGIGGQPVLEVGVVCADMDTLPFAWRRRNHLAERNRIFGAQFSRLRSAAVSHARPARAWNPTFYSY